MRIFLACVLLALCCLVTHGEFLRIRDKQGRLIRNNTNWTPKALVMEAWYDFSDATKITLNGSTISQCTDKSDKGRNITQSTASAQPTYTTGELNGLAVATFDGGDTLNYAVDSFHSSSLTMFVVCRTTESNKIQGVIQKYASGNREWYIGHDQTNKMFLLYNTIGTSSAGDQKSASTASVGTNYCVFGGVKSGTNVIISLNGTTNNVGWTNGAVANGGAGFSVGSGQINSNFFGSVAEIVICSYAINQDEINRMEGYFAWKYGLQGNLPAGHPYKSERPLQ